jgi:hypothetical protein
VSGLTLNSLHCGSCTVICGSIVVSQIVHLQIQLVLGIVSGDSESDLHRVCIVFLTAIISDNCHAFQPLPWSLADPLHVVVTENESRGCIG